MQTVSREKAQELKDAGFKNTEWWREPRAYGTYSDPIRTKDPGPDWLPAPTLSEVLEELSYKNLVDYYGKDKLEQLGCPMDSPRIRDPNKRCIHCEGFGDRNIGTYYVQTVACEACSRTGLKPFSEWLYTTMKDVDAAADVWIKTRRKG